jgi:hypothetical protein
MRIFEFLKGKIRLTITLSVIPFFFCCGANEPEKKAVVEDLSRKVEVERTVMDPESIFPEQKLVLEDSRYLDEQIQSEINNAYAGTGEYIDPKKVVSLVRGSEYNPVPEATLELDLPKEEQDKLIASKTWRISQLTHEEAFKLFLEGDYPGAAAKWKNLATDEIAFTISIEVDCDTATLKNSYEILVELEMPIFIQAVNVKGRSCYRLCAGVFAKMEDADPYIEQIHQKLEGSFPFTTALNK